MRSREIQELNAELFSDYRLGAASIWARAPALSALTVNDFIKQCKGTHCTIDGVILGKREWSNDLCRYCRMVEVSDG